MNRYAAHGLVAAATLGRRIIVLTATTDDLAHTNKILTLAAEADPTASPMIKRGTRAWTLRYPNGGTIHTMPANSNRIRGMTADTIYLDTLADEVAKPKTYEPALAPSTDPEVARA